MGWFQTKFGIGTKFGVPTKFGGYFFPDNFPVDTYNDFDGFLTEYGRTFSVIQQTTINDSLGMIKSITETTFNIMAIIQDITRKDYKLHEMGLAVSGNRKLYIKPSYIVGGTTYTLKEGDILTDTDGTIWRITTVTKQWDLPISEDIYRIAIIKNIDLEGS